MHIALDAGHGASALTSAEAFERLGAKVTAINTDFDGLDINVGCGSTCLEPLEKLIAECGADVGVAHDGDADRVMLMAPGGEVIDGDFMAALLARDMRDRGVLSGNTVVATVMCNLGFVHAMRDAGINVVQTKVGDRYVLEEMLDKGYALGGEQSGHMIMLEYNTTGDGLMTACQYLAAVKRTGKGVQEAVKIMTRFPQALVNVRVKDKEALVGNEAIAEAVSQVEAELGESGRVLIRPSGTEPLVRVMAEAQTQEVADETTNRIAAIVEKELC